MQYKGKDLTKIFKKGDLVMSKYRWTGEPTYDHLYKIVGFGKRSLGIYGHGVDVKLVAVKENSKWITKGSVGDHFNWGDSWLWDFTFDIELITPKNGHGKTFRYTGKVPRGIN